MDNGSSAKFLGKTDASIAKLGQRVYNVGESHHSIGAKAWSSCNRSFEDVGYFGFNALRRKTIPIADLSRINENFQGAFSGGLVSKCVFPIPGLYIDTCNKKNSILAT